MWKMFSFNPEILFKFKSYVLYRHETGTPFRTLIALWESGLGFPCLYNHIDLSVRKLLLKLVRFIESWATLIFLTRHFCIVTGHFWNLYRLIRRKLRFLYEFSSSENRVCPTHNMIPEMKLQDTLNTGYVHHFWNF